MALAYNGWPIIEHPAPGQLVPLVVAGETFAPGVLAGDVHTVFQYLVGRLHERVERVDLGHPADDWGWAFRPSRNDARLASTHGPGTAIDYNATRHPNGKRGTFTPVQVAEIRAALAFLEGVVQWGGDYVGGVVDEMHFEIIRGPAEVARVARKIERLTAPPIPYPTGGDDTMILACELTKGSITYGLLSGGILTGLANAGGADKAAAAGRLHVQWVTAEDWAHLSAKSERLLTR